MKNLIEPEEALSRIRSFSKMEQNPGDEALSKVPAVTLGFWIIKIAATTLGETGGDSVTMTLVWGYLAGTALFLALLVSLVLLQILAKRFHPILYWATIIASTTFGTTMADFADRSLGIGYTGSTSASVFICSAGIVVLVGANNFGEHRQYAESRNILLGRNHIFPDFGNRIGRLAC
jgi:uncharacterized membrane-anchored protein